MEKIIRITHYYVETITLKNFGAAKKSLIKFLNLNNDIKNEKSYSLFNISIEYLVYFK